MGCGLLNYSRMLGCLMIRPIKPVISTTSGTNSAGTRLYCNITSAFITIKVAMAGNSTAYDCHISFQFLINFISFPLFASIAYNAFKVPDVEN